MRPTEGLLTGNLPCPLKGFYHMHDIFSDEVDNGCQRIVVGRNAKIQRASEEVIHTIREMKLNGCCRFFSFDFKKDSINLLFFIGKHSFMETGGFGYVPVDKAAAVLYKVVQGVFVLHWFVAQVYDGFKIREVNICPPGLCRGPVVGDYACVNRVAEFVGKDSIEVLVIFFGKINTEITPGQGSVIAAAARSQKKRKN